MGEGKRTRMTGNQRAAWANSPTPPCGGDRDPAVPANGESDQLFSFDWNENDDDSVGHFFLLFVGWKQSSMSKSSDVVDVAAAVALIPPHPTEEEGGEEEALFLFSAPPRP